MTLTRRHSITLLAINFMYMDRFSVNRLAAMAGVSVRTLHHYDHIGLLKPAERAESRYRYYGKKELLRLQQILFFRELGFPLHEIRQILDDPDFDTLEALRYHRQELERRKARLDTLLLTVDNTIHQLKNEKQMSNYEEMYQGFSREEAKAFDKEAREKYGDKAVEDSYGKVRGLTPQQQDDLRNEMHDVPRELAELMDLTPSDPAVQALVRRHHAAIETFYSCPAERYRCLGQMYTDDERFTAFYDRFRPGLAAFLKSAMDHYCDTVLRDK